METDYAYAAGIIDGEGSILLSKHRKTPYRIPSVSVTSTSLELLQFLKEIFWRSYK